jgi:hypothetical protein
MLICNDLLTGYTVGIKKKSSKNKILFKSFMPESKKSSKSEESEFHRLSAVASAFTDRTRITETMLDSVRGEWLLGFDNGYAVALTADGTWRLVREEKAKEK